MQSGNLDPSFQQPRCAFEEHPTDGRPDAFHRAMRTRPIVASPLWILAAYRPRSAQTSRGIGKGDTSEGCAMHDHLGPRERPAECADCVAGQSERKVEAADPWARP